MSEAVAIYLGTAGLVAVVIGVRFGLMRGARIFIRMSLVASWSWAAARPEIKTPRPGPGRIRSSTITVSRTEFER
jgi:hypothetical protein